MRFKIDCASFIFGINLPFLLRFPLYLRAVFQAQAPRGLYLEGRFNGGFFCVTFLGGVFSAFYGNFTNFIKYALSSGADGFFLTGPCQKLKNRGKVYNIRFHGNPPYCKACSI